MQLASQPYSGGPAILKGFGTAQMKTILLNGEWDGETEIKKNLGISGVKFSNATLLPGGPNEVSELVPCAEYPRLVLVLAGSGYCLSVDYRAESPYKGQPTIFRMTAAREEGVFVPKGFCLGFLFSTPSCLFLEISNNLAICGEPINPFSGKISFDTACGVSERQLKLYSKG